MTVGGMKQGISQWFVVGRNEKLTSFEVVSEMFDCKVNRKKFTSKGAVSSLCRLETFGEKLKWFPRVVNFLLENCTDCKIGGICHETQWCVWFGMGQQG